MRVSDLGYGWQRANGVTDRVYSKNCPKNGLVGSGGECITTFDQEK